MTHLFRSWSRCAARMRHAELIGLLCDFDGTLSPIAGRPEIPRLSPTSRQVLHALAKDSRVAVGIVSGRTLRDLRSRVRLPGVYYAGNHGLELEGPGLRFLHPRAAAARPVLLRIVKELRKRLRGVGGVLVEDKRLTLSLHLRRVPEAQRATVQDVFTQSVRPFLEQKAIRVTRGKMVLEVRPAVAWDKGSAVRLIREAVQRNRSPRGMILCYLGDDETDEAAFRVLRKEDLAIYVGGRKQGSAASFYLRDPGEVTEFLTRLRSTVAA